MMGIAVYSRLPRKEVSKPTKSQSIILHQSRSSTGDGTTVSCSVRLVVIAFVIIHDETIANSPNDHYTIALVNCKENYVCIAECITDLVTENGKLKLTSSW